MRAAIVVLALAVALCSVTAVDAADHHRLARLRLRQQHLHHEAEAEAEVAEVDTVEADAQADESVAAIEADAQTESSAAVAALVAAGEAAYRAQMDKEFARHRVMHETGTTIDTAKAAAEADAARAAAGVYHADHLTACVSMHGWLAGLGGGFAAAAGPLIDDPTVQINWNNAQHPILAVRQKAQQITDYVRWGQRMGLAHAAVCTLVLLTPVVLAYDRRSAGNNFLARYTIGLEWELHWLQVLPSNDHNPTESFPLWRSGMNTNPAGQRWLTIVNDHSGQQKMLAVGTQSRTIVEVVFGPNFCNSASHIAGSATDIAIGDSRLIITNLKHALENGANAFGFESASALAAGLDARTATMGHRPQHAFADWVFDNTYDRTGLTMFGTAGFADPTRFQVFAGNGGNALYPGPQREFYFRPMGMNPEGGMAANYAAQWTPAVVVPGAWNNEYIQTNFLMPVSALASTRFVTVETAQWQKDAVTAVRLAARSYLLNYDAAGILELSANDRGDLLGAFTGLFYQALYGTCTNTAYYTPAESGVPTSTPKNWHDYMLKTSFHRVFLLLSPAVTHVLYRLYAATDLSTAGNNAVDQALDYLRLALLVGTNDPLVIAWGTKMTGGGGPALAIRAWAARTLLRNYLSMAYPPTILANAAWSAAPSGSNPPAYVATNDLIPSVVIESRYYQNTLNTEVKDGTIATINAELAHLQRQFTWNGINTAFCV